MVGEMSDNVRKSDIVGSAVAHNGDILRDRIKQAVDQAHASAHPHSTYDDWLTFAADAVIAALGLKKDSEMALDDEYRVVPMHRYVTEWTDGI